MPIVQSSQKNYMQYLNGGGEMGRLTREFDWSATVIGSPDTWSQSLLTTISIILNSRFPMFLWWGPDLIQFYNDAYRPSLGNDGKHPKALGQKGENCWQEIWPVIEPLIGRVMAGGESTWSEDQLIPIFRNNRLEDVYWTFSYSPVIDQTGNCAGVLVICNETTSKVKAYNQMLEAKKELEFTIEAAELGTWDLNPATSSFKGNDRLKLWFDLPLNEEIELDKAIEKIIDQDRERVIEAIQKAIKKGSDGNYNVTYSIVNPGDKSLRVVKAIGKAVFDAEGNASRFSGTLEDVTTEHQLQQRKDEFISIASHELKTPLTSLKASIQIIQKIIKTDILSTRLPLFIDKASNNLNKMLYLMEDLMNVSKIQQGQLALNKTRINLVDLVNDCCEHLGMGATHHLQLIGDRELFIDADYRRIDQVVINLVNNAIKYSPLSDRVEIKVEHDAEHAKISVRDFGIGISPEKLPHLFDRYYRVDSSGVQYSGLGLGLYISAEIVRRHNGHIGVQSEINQGSTFWFNLPMD